MKSLPYWTRIRHLDKLQLGGFAGNSKELVQWHCAALTMSGRERSSIRASTMGIDRQHHPFRF